jgi:hypothetical protein
MRRFEDAAILLDEATGDTHRLHLTAAALLERLRSGPAGELELTVAGQPAGVADAEWSLAACRELLHDLDLLGLVVPLDAAEAEPETLPR